MIYYVVKLFYINPKAGKKTGRDSGANNTATATRASGNTFTYLCS